MATLRARLTLMELEARLLLSDYRIQEYPLQTPDRGRRIQWEA
jgi:hypothetical protein